MYPAPNPKQERKRIESNGGVVMPSRMPGVGYVGPARVWDRSQRYGLACSRSMGDTVRPTLQPTLRPTLQHTHAATHAASRHEVGPQPAACVPCRDHARAMHGVQVYVNGPENAGGVISEPEISSHRLSKGDKVLIFGSDGVWDHVSSAEAVAIAANAKTPQAASDRIAQIARERWRRNGPMQDDITAVVVGLN